ncbi:potassium transporter TrkA [Dactylosporangium sp. NPDC050688]|uniref:potassium transporter TrkA n=1 Tax=Dactylosporangium sp. NPDC050688 TaxID=3157217 RepID=UPI0033C4A720
MSRDGPVSIAVIGTGEFATVLCRALATAGLPPASTVHVIGRTPGAAERVCAAADAAAGPVAVDAAAAFRPVHAEIGPTADVRGLLARLRPGVVVLCASLQSPAEFRGDGSRWAQLVRTAGFAVTLPLQAALAAPVAAACADVGGDRPVTFVNACFPDAVNPTLHARGLPVLCGLGNVASLAAAAGAALDLTDPARLKILAHHAHLHRPPHERLEARWWVDDVPHADVGTLLEAARGSRGRLNNLGATVAAGMVRALAVGGEWTGHAPGPLGLPGGFPVEIRDGTLTLRLPPGVPLTAALAWTAEVSALDGATVAPDGVVRLTDQARGALAAHLPGLPATFAPQALPGLCTTLLELRERLRGQEPEESA